MTIRCLPAGLWRFAIDELTPEPWKNGQGLTRTVAHDGRDPHDSVWRVSCADITHDSPYSPFAGMDRQQILLDGPGLALHAGDARYVLSQRGEGIAFPGDAEAHAVLHDGPVRVWNVMTSRGACASNWRLHRQPRGELAFPSHALALLVLVLEGCYQLHLPDMEDDELAAGHGLVLYNPIEGLVLEPDWEPCTLLFTEILSQPATLQ